MKNKFKLLGIIAIVAIIGFSMAACEDDSGGGDVSITLSGDAKVGAVITATVEGSTKYEIYWEILDEKDDEEGFMGNGKTAGENDEKYTVEDSAEGKFLRAEVMDMDNGNKALSNVIGPIAAE
jgi:hypothetical protein